MLKQVNVSVARKEMVEISLVVFTRLAGYSRNVPYPREGLAD